MLQGVFAGEAPCSSQLKLSTEKRKVGGSTPPLPTASDQLKDPERLAPGVFLTTTLTTTVAHSGDQRLCRSTRYTEFRLVANSSSGSEQSVVLSVRRRP
jgi:hypothetical protein